MEKEKAVPVDINALDFVDTFDITKGTVGVIGHGYVGKAVDNFFAKKTKVVVYDKAKHDLKVLEEVVRTCEVIFVCVPTPMQMTGPNAGACHTGIVDEVLLALVMMAKEVRRNLDSFVVVVKSTVWPGYTDQAKKLLPGLRLVFSPEFLTEANSLKDFEETNRVVLGGEVDDARVVYKFFEGIFDAKVKMGMVTIAACEPKVAEMVKLYTNGILMIKVLFSNEIYLMCKELGIEYNDVRFLSCLDRRIGGSHTMVPGPDGQLGAGGHCFPKDINNLRYVCKQLGIPEKIFTAVIERNEEVREKKDWEEMKGRAVIDG